MNRTIAICYDFDGTLCPRYMQECGYIPQLGVKPKQFWKMALDLAKTQNANPILCYMFLMVREAGMLNGVEPTRTSFQKHGRDIDFFPGVTSWFGLMW